MHIAGNRLERFAPLVGDERVREALERAEVLRRRLAGRAIWNVNSTAVGGGVAEMLPPLLAYTRPLGIDTRWVVMRGDRAFFRVTKRLHHALHGSPGDGRELDEVARAIYEECTSANGIELCNLARAGDIVILHDPQTAGMIPHLAQHGVHTIWRCHIGSDARNSDEAEAWAFLMPYLRHADAYVFSRPAYVPPQLEGERVMIIQPSIDAFSPKNQELSRDRVLAILGHVGLIECGGPCEGVDLAYTRGDGTPGRVERHADIIRSGRSPTPDAPLVVQVSRWDPLKDMVGVLRGFAALDREAHGLQCELVLAGPNVNAVADDPEGPAIFDEVLRTWFSLPAATRNHVQLAMLPTEDPDENAAIVNALQRHATIVVQKSLHEGFGLTVTEAMWKGRPVVASKVGGIQDQIVDGVHGCLLDDPTDLDAFRRALEDLLRNPQRREEMGRAARERVLERFLGIRHLLDYAAPIGDILDRDEQTRIVATG